MGMRRRRLLAAVRDRMRQDASGPAAPPASPPAPPRRRPAAEHDDELERLEAEARYHHDRADLYRAKTISGSSTPTTPGRLRALERTAAAAADRLATAKRSRAGRS
jgi:hypothetical protein